MSLARTTDRTDAPVLVVILQAFPVRTSVSIASRPRPHTALILVLLASSASPHESEIFTAGFNAAPASRSPFRGLLRCLGIPYSTDLHQVAREVVGHSMMVRLCRMDSHCGGPIIAIRTMEPCLVGQQTGPACPSFGQSTCKVARFTGHFIPADIARASLAVLLHDPSAAAQCPRSGG